MKIIIDAGHGGKDSGGGCNEFWLEKDINLQISLYQFERLKNLGIDVKLTRDKDTYLYSTKRTDIVKASGATICISNHINSFSNNLAKGAEAFHSIYSDGKLATIIVDNLVKEGATRRGVFTKTLPDNPKRDYYYMHRLTGSVQTVIVEYGFASNEEDTKKILKDQEAYAEAVVKAICEYANIEYKAPSKKDKWKYDTLEYLNKIGILDDLEGWKEKIEDPMPVWAVCELIKKLYENIKEDK